MSLNDINDNKPTYGTVPAVTVDSGTTKGSRRDVVVGLAAAACFLLGVAAANVIPTQGLRGTALYAKYYNNEDGIDNISVGDVTDGGCVGGPCGAGGASVKPAPATPPVKPVPGVPGVPGVGGDGNVSPPTPPATPATPTPATPAASSCCQVFGACPAGYLSSGNVNANSVCCKDYSHGININSDMPYCPTTPADSPFPNPDWTMGDPIGPITTPKVGPIPTPDTETGLGPIQTGNPNGMFEGGSVFGKSGSPFGSKGFDGGMSFPGMPDSAASTPGGGYKNNGY